MTLGLLAKASLASAQPSPVTDLVNPLAYSCGIPIGDGHVHTIATAPPGSCFNGIKTLAALAALRIGEITPFAFLTDSGTQVGPMADWHGSINPFLAAHGAYRLTDAKVAGLDIAWLAIQASALQGATHLAGGTYIIGSAMPLPIMLPLYFIDIHAFSGSGPLFLGDGAARSTLVAGSSFGTLEDGVTNIPLMSCGDPGATPANKLGRWHPNYGQCNGTLQGIRLWGDPRATAVGLASTYRTDGLALGARLATVDVEADNFYNDITITGDHTLHTRLKANAGVFGLYFTAPNTVLVGDWQFIDLGISGQSFASVRVDGNSSINAIFDGETYLNAAYYAIFGEANGCDDIIYASHFSHLDTEYLGLGTIHDEHVFDPATGSYDDSRKCRGVNNTFIDTWFNQFNNRVTSSDTNRRRRAVFDIGGLSGVLHGLNPNGGGFVPIADKHGPAGVASFNINRVGSDGSQIGLDIEGQMATIFRSGEHAGADGAAIPFFPSLERTSTHANLEAAGITWREPGGNGGIFAPFHAVGSEPLTVKGDLLELRADSPGVAVPAGVAAAQPVIGVVAQAGLRDGMIVPLQTSGESYVAIAAPGVASGSLSKGSGIGARARIQGGTGGRDGSYDVMTQGCAINQAVTVTVSGGAVVSAVPSGDRPASGCTVQPTLSLAGIPGLNGANVIPQWPAAGVDGEGSGRSIGYALHARRGTPATGINIYARLQIAP